MMDKLLLLRNWAGKFLLFSVLLAAFTTFLIIGGVIALIVVGLFKFKEWIQATKIYDRLWVWQLERKLSKKYHIPLHNTFWSWVVMKRYQG